MFRSGESVNIDNVEQLRHHAPREGEFLSGMGVQRLILAPVWQDGEISAFIGVDNPSVNAHASGQIETIAMLLADRLVRDKTKDRLQELLNLHYEDILKATDLGLWVIRLKKDGSAQEMYVDQTMRSILGIRENLTPQEVYHHWYNRINPGYFHYVNYSLEHMIESGRTVELRYTWNHPIKGETTVRFLGIRVADLEDYICLEGYHREINEVDMPHYMPEATSIIFEYNESKASIYFHNKRHPLAGEEEREDNFPQCWVESGMVHPHFARQFADVFRDIRNKPDQNGRELRLKTKDGGYEWFKLKTRHLSSDSHDANTMIVILDPANQTRTMELEYSRQKDFYNAILAEKIAYAEIDMESHRILHMGGLWANYADKTTRNETPYEQVMLHYADLLVHPEDLKSYKSFIQADSVYGMLDQKDGNKIQLRRLINGEMRWVELTAHTFQDGVTGNVFALMYMRDIDAAKRRELQHELAATRDPLTKVFNRLTFEEEVVRHMTENREANCGTLLLIDMDNFKEVNDRYGHSEGDAVLMALTDILLTTFRRKDLIGRFGGDEFLVFLKNVTDKKVINRRMEELKSALVGLGQWNVTCSVGAVRIPAGPFDYGESIRKADEAMYFSKDKGKNAFSFYDELR